MCQSSVGGILVLVTILGHVAGQQSVSVQLAGNDTEAVQGTKGFCVKDAVSEHYLLFAFIVS